MSSGCSVPSAFNFCLSCDIDIPVSVKLEGLQGCLPVLRPGGAADGFFSESVAVFVVAELISGDERIGLTAFSNYADCSLGGAIWKNPWLTFCVKYRDLGPDSRLAFSLWQVVISGSWSLVGGCTLPLFNRRGQLHTGLQRLHIWEGLGPCVQTPTTTPGRIPKPTTSEVERLESLLARFDVDSSSSSPWMNALAFQTLARFQAEDAEKWVGRHELRLNVFLPIFKYPV
eukprot:CAMPEP_0175053276 /NCGR_PEP_ID=MMETSP0052_2-20121109/8831_1 /TAXON_ID=51329 ORGANISM="Polytomella parva, Strain SAG 63-3" /NCGR_SAMPLE_ID=MMETSP0052_2 /ASSEMBLY_ACC=CAM_ASM_000194 /LENGTH=228 /DNA_ID=CAMNT_0016317785 /DNA_START=243 /DNA_END=925 /DNA_ORIENTATION=-